jgi:RNA polymerase sigma-70 factor (ECF subfamily)
MESLCFGAIPAYCVLVDEPLDAWFKREILVHEEALVRFLRRHWRSSPDEIHDLRQETYTRVYAAALKSRPTQPRSFLFTSAKHLLTDHVRRQRVITIDTVGDLDSLNVVVDDLSPERRVAARQELRVLAHAFDHLPPRCRETVWMRRVDQMPQKEVAARLGIDQKTVEKHLRKGMKLLADALFGNELTASIDENEVQEVDNESAHGKQQAD